MAANSSSRGIVDVGKRISSQIWTRSSLVASSRRAAHTSAYDKNPDDQAHPSHSVPDELIQSNSDKYWAPDPRTGVFGPATGPVSAAGGVQATAPSSGGGGGGGGGGGEGSVLEQKAWFRPTSIEDLEKPAMP